MLILSEISIATLISQSLNMSIGYFLYGKKVFKIKKYSKISIFKYFFLASFLWLMNWISITFLTQIGISKSISAIITIPILVTFSFIGQKLFVFKTNL